jgi:FAD/FMN-containing dehydrogenase
VTGGRVGHTGIGGLTLGGGIGWLTRTCGLTCDNLISADLVTADGEHVHATADATPELFWALRGGGGNFGVVTRFEFALHPVGPDVIAGLMVYPPERGAEVLGAWEEFRKQAPEELNTMIYMQRTPKWDMLPEGLRNREGYVFSLGSLLGYEETREALAPMRALQPGFELLGPMRYTTLQTLTDADHSFGTRIYARGHRLAKLDAAAIEVIVEYYRRRPKTGSRFYIEHMEGAVQRLREEDTAFPDRSSPYSIAILGWMRNDADVAPVTAWTREFWRDLKPHATGASYLNWLGVEEEAGRVTTTFGLEKHRKLAAIKRRWDPENVFRLNPNIEPAAASSAS